MLPDPYTSRVVLIGTHTYRYLDDLPSVANNLIGLKNVFASPDSWGISPDNCVILEQMDDPRSILDTIHEAAADASSVLLVYYAGHGLTSPHDEELYLSLPSSRSDRLHWALRYDDVRRAILSSRSPAARIMILDCCYSARAMIGGMSAPADLADRSRISGTYILAAAAETKMALAPPDAEYTAFTGELVSALTSGIRNAPQFLDLETLFNYVRSRLLEKGCPLPEQRSRNDGARIVLGRNRRYRAAHSSVPVERHQSVADSLKDLLHGQLRAARNFPYALTGTPRAGLSSVYVRQQLSLAPTSIDPDDSEESNNASPLEGSRQPRGTESRRPFIEALQQHRHLIIVGDPGQGKSVLTLQTMAELAASHLEGVGASGLPGRQSLLPVRVAARDLATRTGPLTHMLLESAAAELGPALDHPLPTNLIDLAPPDARWLVIVDGLDEIADPIKAAAMISLLATRMAETEHRLRWFITTRSLTSADILALLHPDVGYYRLEPFDRGQLASFAARWFDADAETPSLAGQFIHEIRNMGLNGLIQVPLLATIAAILYQQLPDHTLPNSQYTLYEHYFTYLMRAYDDPFKQHWSHITQYLAQSVSENVAQTDLSALRRDLLECVALAAVSGNEDIEAQALKLLENSGYREAASRLPEWRILIGRLLESTGFFVRSGNTLRFAHLTFAEHLAAEARARQLPTGFDALDPAWDLVMRDAATGRRDALAVLVHWTYRCSDVDELLTWLEHGSEPWKALAGRLLAEGPPAASVHTMRFLEHFKHQLQLASRYEYGTGDILEDEFNIVQRLGSDTAAREFLTTVANDPAYRPWQRVKAARALAAHSEGVAAKALRAAIADKEFGSEGRVKAAIELSALGDHYISEAAYALVSLIADTNVSGYDRRDAVNALVDFDGQFRTEISNALKVILRATEMYASDRLMAAQDLTDLDVHATGEVVQLMRAVLGDTTIDLQDRAAAADDLARLDERYVDEAAIALRGILSAEDATGYVRLYAATSMLYCGGAYVAEAVRALRGLADLTTRPSWDRSTLVQQRAAIALGTLGGAYVDEAADILTTVIAASDTYDHERGEAADELARLTPPHTDQAAHALRNVICHPEADVSQRLNAAKILARLGREYIDEAARSMIAISSAESVPVPERLAATAAIDRLGSAYTSAALRALRAIMADPHAEIHYRIKAAEALSRHGTQYAREAADGVRAVLAAPGVSMRARYEAAILLVNLGPWFTDEAARALRTVMTADSALDERIWAARLLGTRFGPHHTDEAAAALQAGIVAAKTSWSARKGAAEQLAEFGPSYKELAISALLNFIASKGLGASARIEVSNFLNDKFGPQYSQEAAQALGAVITARDTEYFDRKEATIALYTLSPPRQYIDATVRNLRTLADELPGPQSELLNLAIVLNETPTRNTRT